MENTRVLFIPSGPTRNSEPGPDFLSRLKSGYEYSQRGDSDKGKKSSQWIFLIAGGVLDSGGYTEAEIGGMWLQREGVSKERILVETESTDSVSNVTDSIEKFPVLRGSTIFVFSQSPHASRIQRAFTAAGIRDVFIVGCPYGSRRTFLKAIPYECVAWILYRWDPLGTGILARLWRRTIRLRRRIL